MDTQPLPGQQLPTGNSAFPDEALEPVAQHLPPLDVVRLAGVSRAWRAELGRAVLTDWIRVPSKSTEQSRASAAAWLSKNLNRTRELEVMWRVRYGSPPPIHDLLTGAAPAANGLQRLRFNSNLQDLPSLSTCTALRHLNFTCCEHITQLPPLDTVAPHLTRLDVCTCQTRKPTRSDMLHRTGGAASGWSALYPVAAELGRLHGAQGADSVSVFGRQLHC